MLHHQREHGPERCLAAIEMLQRAVPREGYNVISDNEIIGRVTSGCFSPTLQKGICLAMIRTPCPWPGAGISVDIRGKLYPGRIAKSPFYSTLRRKSS